MATASTSGALATYTDLAESALVLNRCPLLAQAAEVVGDVQVRNRGTVRRRTGPRRPRRRPAGRRPGTGRRDSRPPDPTGERWIPVREFFITMLTTSLMPEELLTEIRVPARDGYKSAYRKASRQAAGFAIVGVAACLKESADGVCEDIAIGVTGVGDVAYRAEKVEEALRGRKLDDSAIAKCRGVGHGRRRPHRGRQRHPRLPFASRAGVLGKDDPGSAGGRLVWCLVNSQHNLRVFFAPFVLSVASRRRAKSKGGCVALPRVVPATARHRALPTTKNPPQIMLRINQTPH